MHRESKLIREWERYSEQLSKSLLRTSQTKKIVHWISPPEVLRFDCHASSLLRQWNITYVSMILDSIKIPDERRGLHLFESSHDFWLLLSATSCSFFWNKIHVCRSHYWNDSYRYWSRVLDTWSTYKVERFTNPWKMFRGSELISVPLKSLDIQGQWYTCEHKHQSTAYSTSSWIIRLILSLPYS